MTTLDFTIDEREVSETWQLDDFTGPAGALFETCFFAPVRFNVAGTEMFEINQQPRESRRFLAGVEGTELGEFTEEATLTIWLTLPLLGIAIGCLEQIQKAAVQGEERYSLPGGGHLDFKCKNSLITVYSSVNGRSATDSYEEVVRAFLAFKDRVKGRLEAQVPELTKNPFWLRTFI